MSPRAQRQPAVHLTLDSSGRVLDAAGGAGSIDRLFGTTQLEGRHIVELVPPATVTEWWVSLLLTRGGEPFAHRPLHVRTELGSHWALVSGTGLPDDDDARPSPPAARSAPRSGRVLLRFSHITPTAAPGAAAPTLGASPEGAGHALAPSAEPLPDDVYRQAFESAASALAITSVDGILLRVNASFADLVGRDAEDLLGRSVMHLLHADDWQPWHEGAATLLGGTADRVRMDRRYLRPDGSLVHAAASSALLIGLDGRPQGLFTQLMDIGEHVRRTEALSHAAEHDALTGLANRVPLERTLRRWLGEAEHGGQSVAAVVIDLDGFKAVNDTFGHATGDALLSAVAARLQGAVRSGDLAGRLGGDEFAVIARATSADQLSALANRLREALRGTIAVGGLGITVRASLGVAVVSPGASASPREGLAPEQLAAASAGLLRAADLTMYEDKRRAARAVGTQEELL